MSTTFNFCLPAFVRPISFITVIAFITFIPKTAWAAMSLEFSGLPAAVQDESEFTLSVSLGDAPANTTYYLRAAFYQEGTTNYFGYTYNHLGSWINATNDHTQFLQITTNSAGSFAGPLKAKADTSSPRFDGAGQHFFKIGRYTQGGSGPTWSGAQTITINATPTQTPTPSPTPTPTDSPAPTPKPPTSTIAPSATTLPTSKPSPKPTQITPQEEQPEIDLGIIDAAASSASATPTPAVLGTTRRRPILPTILMIVGGLLTLGFGIPLAIGELRSRKGANH